MTLAKCPSSAELTALKRGEIGAERRAQFDEHVTNCPQCQLVLQRLSNGAAMLPGEPTTPGFRTPPGFQPRKSDTEKTLDRPVQIPDGTTLAGAPALPPQEPRVNLRDLLQPPVDPSEIGRLGNYRVLGLLGAGGMGLVFHAEDLMLRRPTALKVIRPDWRDQTEGWHRLMREARSMAAIKHEHLVTVYQAGREGDVFFLAMELLEGESLDDRMRREPKVTVPELLRIAREMSAGLGAIHQHGLVHRDIKPSNIWLEAPDGKVRILDFGLARSISGEHSTNLTERGTVVGTPAYMSPEHARGENIDGRSDLFSVGCVLYCLCTGQKPFKGDTLMAQLTSLAVDDPQPPRELNPDLPPALAQLVIDLLDKNPQRRPGTTEELIARIKQIESGETQPVSKPPAAKPKAPRPQTVYAELPQTAPPGSTVSSATTAKEPEQSNWPVVAVILLLVGMMIVVWGVWPGPEQAAQNKKGTPEKLFSDDRERPPPDDGSRKRLPRTNEPPVDLEAGSAAAVKQMIAAHLKDDGAPRTFALNIPDVGGDAVYFPPGSGRPDKKLAFTPPDMFREFSLLAQVTQHAIGMHPSPEGSAFINLKLGKKYKRFSAVVSQNDRLPRTEGMVFLVSSAGKVLFKSKPVSTQADTQRIDISVEGIDVLRLEVDAENPRAAHALWFEPYLTE